MMAWTDKDVRENKDYIHRHTNERNRNRWSEEGKGQVREGTEKKLWGQKLKEGSEKARSDTWGLFVGLWGWRLLLPQDKNPPSSCITTPYFKTNTPIGTRVGTRHLRIIRVLKWQLCPSKTSNDTVLHFMLNTFCSTQHPNLCVES